MTARDRTELIPCVYSSDSIEVEIAVKSIDWFCAKDNVYMWRSPVRKSTYAPESCVVERDINTELQKHQHKV